MHTHAHVLQEELALPDVAATDLNGGLVDEPRTGTSHPLLFRPDWPGTSGLSGLQLQARWPAPSGLAGLHLRPVWPALQA